MITPSHKKQEMKIDDALSNDKFKEYSDRERYCMNEFIKYMNLRSASLKYIFLETSSASKEVYDGKLIIKNKYSDKIIGWQLCEIKVRDTDYATQDRDNDGVPKLVLDCKKYNNLKREQIEYKKQGGSIGMGIWYINFTASGTYIFDITGIYENNELPKKRSYEADEYTAKASDKITKFGYFLPVYQAHKRNWIYDKQEYLQTLQKDVVSKTETIKKITTGVIF